MATDAFGGTISTGQGYAVAGIVRKVVGTEIVIACANGAAIHCTDADLIPTSKSDFDALWLPLAGGTMSGNIDMDANAVLFGPWTQLADSGDSDILKFQANANDIAEIHPSAPAASLVIDSAGKVGFGISTPLDKLYVFEPTSNDVAAVMATAKVGGGAVLKFANVSPGNSWWMGMLASVGDFYIYDFNYAKIPFYIAKNSPTWQLTVKSTGVGIGKATAASTLDIGGSLAHKATTVTSTTYTAAATETVILCDCDTAGAGITITLPAASGVTDRVYHVKNTSSTYSVTLDGNGSETIDGSTTLTIGPLESAHVACDGSEWWII